MDWITAISNAFTQLAAISKERLSTLLVIGLFVFGFYSQYSTIQDQKEQIKLHEENCTQLVAKIREENRVQYDEQTNLFQKQINEFILRKNKENDSVYNYFYNLTRKHSYKVKQISNEIETIKEHEKID